MNVANLELCKELDRLSGWNDTELYWYQNWLMHDRWMVGTRTSSAEESYSAYDLSYLLRKLPKSITEFWGRAYPASPCLMYSGTQWVIFYQSEMTGEHNTDELFGQFADTPEDAACMLAIELFKQDILRMEKK